ncbi:MAG TPA: NBR1-Ig-like domain-containing protein [Anaerolineales bacterium]|nr:NBR1-Ig-like domain-containing protein [Anaerolineales bacterium]
MKWKVQAASALLLVALVLSFIPAAAMHSSASAAQACTDRAQFVTDVTVPDGTRYEPGATFKKTWRLKNVGSCTWSTSYTMVFDSGTQMGSTASVNLPSSTAPGQTVDVSVDMTAPNTAGHYIGYWKFKNAAGTLFGIGVNANKSWWVEINVVGGSGDTGVAYDFTANAGSATWSSGAGGLTFPGNDGDAKGFALKLDNPTFESGVTASQPGLLVSPHQITNGYIQASYPEFTVQNGDRFQATVGCQAAATSCYVAYRLDYQVGNTIRTFWTFREKFEGWTYTANLNLSPLAGQSVKFILYVSAWGSPVGDRALWGNPIIARPGATPVTPVVTVTGTPPTATPTKTSGPATVPPSSCDKAQFIADVTVPDGTLMSPGQRFTKTWRLRNVGTCAWTKSYQIVFYSGEQMGAPASLTFAQDVPVGGTADFTIEMTAPSAAGSYRGNWMFKNASGQLFGIGAQANRPWWVDIRVSGPTVTPGGATVTPGGATVTPGANMAYDFATNACAATWYTGAGQIPASQCPGTDGDAKGFVLKVTNPKLESGATDSRPGIITFPQNVQNGYIQGFFPTFRVQNGDRFRSVINCEYNATNCYVAFRLDYEQGGTIRTFWGPFLERYEGRFYNVDVDLSPLAGRDVKFILTVLAAGVATGDRALWVGPHIYRAGASPATSAPTTAVPTTGTTVMPTTAIPTTATTPAGTTAVPTTAVPSETPSPTNTGAPDESATPTPTSTTGSTSGYYQNTKYNFRFSLPSGANIVSQSDTVGQVSLPIMTAGTNLLSKYIQIHVREGINPCVSPAVDNPLTTEDVTINNIAFTKQTGQGAAAGNRYDWTAYSTVSNNACISLAFVLHSANSGNYATPPPEFDKAAESAVIDATMATYSRITS